MKEFVPEEPMELVGVAIPGGDDSRMAECLVEEFLLMGWNERQLLRLFSHPFFAATHRIYRERGEGYVRDLIRRIGEQWSNPSPAGGGAHA